MMWSYGGQEIDAKGKVIINSKETIESVKFMAQFWKDAHDEGGLAWDDSNNNRAFLSGDICASLNGASIYVAALNGADKFKTEKGAPLHTDILHAPLPSGPKGTFPYHTAFTHMVMKYSKNAKGAKEFLRWAHTPANYEKWFVVQKGFAIGPTTRVGEAQDVGCRSGDAAVQGRGTRRPAHGLCRRAGPEGCRGVEQVHHRRHVRERGERQDEARGVGQGGRGRARQDLYVTVRP